MADTGLVRAKRRSVIALALAEVFAMSLWFVSAAILPDMLREVYISALRQAALSSSVQAGFVAGALVSAITGLSDRLDPRKPVPPFNMDLDPREFTPQALRRMGRR